MKHKLESRCCEKYSNLRYPDGTTLMAESRGTEEPLDESEEES